MPPKVYAKKMKLIVFIAAILPYLFVTKLTAQNELKEKLKELENSAFVSRFEVQNSTDMESAKASTNFNLRFSQSIDSLIAFVRFQKATTSATFENSVAPYIGENLRELGTSQLEFTDQEELILDSFFKMFQWKSAPEICFRYEDFIAKNFKSPADAPSVCYVLSYLKYIQLYQNIEPSPTTAATLAAKMNAVFERYNSVHWMVFAKHPCATLLWLVATLEWDSKP
jgi:hypothetical protein